MYVTERARFSQRNYARFYPSSNQADDEGILCETRRTVLRMRERTRVRDRNSHGSCNAVSREIARHRIRQMTKENCAEQGVRFCTRGSVRVYVTERARFSQRNYARFYPSSNQADDEGILCETRRTVLRMRERTRVRDRNSHGSCNAVSREIARHRIRQMTKENCAEQGVRFCTRGSVRVYVTERARFSQRSYARFYSSSESLTELTSFFSKHIPLPSGAVTVIMPLS